MPIHLLPTLSAITQKLNLARGRWKIVVGHRGGTAVGNAAIFVRHRRFRGPEHGLAHHFVGGHGSRPGTGGTSPGRHVPGAAMRTRFGRASVRSACARVRRILGVMAGAGFVLVSTPPSLWAQSLAPAHPIGRLRLIGEQRLPFRMQFGKTTIGGLSGLDYDRRHRDWVSESDDKSEFSPARFYTLQLDYDANAFTAARVEGVTLLRQADGTLYPDRAHAPAGGEVPDLESVRVDPRDGSIWYASEGDPEHGRPPFVRQATREGLFLAGLPLPSLFQFSREKNIGPRPNLTFEGLTFAPDGKTLWVSMESALRQDGPVSTVSRGTVSRITHFDRSGRVLAQFAYPVDAIPVAPAAGKWADNGVAEILAVTATRFLTLERSGSEDAAGIFHFYIRIYEIALDDATDISAMPTLAGSHYRPVRKRLIADLRQSGLTHVDNLEGMSWGPRLANGHASLVLVSDDNFNANQVTQFVAFEVVPAPPSKIKK